MNYLFKACKGENIKKLLISILVSEGTGLLSSLLSTGTYEMYENLEKPAFAPPGWIFGPVWFILYLLIGLGSYRIWKMRPTKFKGKNPLVMYLILLFFSFLWPIFFFGLGLRGFALLDMIILMFFVITTTARFYKLDKTAAYLMLPYGVWSAFALILNFSTWVLNR
ncbi:MAG: tryptophan-rich sensory protein [Clostridiales bacterium]|jgi:tryptophan-rich sensory protein|nr:tryptophan-rich sensory protein [Eubacteriales bacterium]MDH7565791.1 tryptophan-rich sensory protein [Clostridiales bacterium]